MMSLGLNEQSASTVDDDLLKFIDCLCVHNVVWQAVPYVGIEAVALFASPDDLLTELGPSIGSRF